MKAIVKFSPLISILGLATPGQTHTALVTLSTLEVEHELHLRKQQEIYDRKRAAKTNTMKNSKVEAITMDYSRNFPCPNIQTNDVYYSR